MYQIQTHHPCTCKRLWLVVPPINTVCPKWRQLLNLSVPANEFAALAVLVSGDPPSTAKSLRRDQLLEDGLVRFDWLPMQHGALLETTGAWRENDLYDPAANIFVLETRLLANKSRKVRGLFEQEANTDLYANLLRHRGLYRSILDRWQPGSGEHESTERYREYIERQLATVETNLEHVAASDQ